MAALIDRIVKNRSFGKAGLQTTMFFVMAVLLSVPGIVWVNRPVPGEAAKVVAVQGRIVFNQSFGNDYEMFSAFMMDSFDHIIGREQADIYVFPETLTGVYDTSKSFDQAMLHAITAFARKRSAYTACLVLEKDFQSGSDDNKYSSCLLTGPDQVVPMTSIIIYIDIIRS